MEWSGSNWKHRVRDRGQQRGSKVEAAGMMEQRQKRGGDELCPAQGFALGGKMETSLTLSSEEGEFVLFDVQSQV